MEAPEPCAASRRLLRIGFLALALAILGICYARTAARFELSSHDLIWASEPPLGLILKQVALLAGDLVSPVWRLHTNHEAPGNLFPLSYALPLHWFGTSYEILEKTILLGAVIFLAVFILTVHSLAGQKPGFDLKTLNVALVVPATPYLDLHLHFLPPANGLAVLLLLGLVLLTGLCTTPIRFKFHRLALLGILITTICKWPPLTTEVVATLAPLGCYLLFLFLAKDRDPASLPSQSPSTSLKTWLLPGLVLILLPLAILQWWPTIIAHHDRSTQPLSEYLVYLGQRLAPTDSLPTFSRSDFLRWIVLPLGWPLFALALLFRRRPQPVVLALLGTFLTCILGLMLSPVRWPDYLFPLLVLGPLCTALLMLREQNHRFQACMSLGLVIVTLLVPWWSEAQPPPFNGLPRMLSENHSAIYEHGLVLIEERFGPEEVRRSKHLLVGERIHEYDHLHEHLPLALLSRGAGIVELALTSELHPPDWPDLLTHDLIWFGLALERTRACTLLTQGGTFADLLFVATHFFGRETRLSPYRPSVLARSSPGKLTQCFAETELHKWPPGILLPDSLLFLAEVQDCLRLEAPGYLEAFTAYAEQQHQVLLASYELLELAPNLCVFLKRPLRDRLLR
ncbi:MAG: hypothetical protein A2284_05945 [Deltaproteobacteria bacterium RIFOXYA12_FULL_61_11]|nr:MAG: hypothetical protein A2284_05945 [Deltaproteobacteria bacterium RIFOXYA12_FULL_61_11]